MKTRICLSVLFILAVTAIFQLCSCSPASDSTETFQSGDVVISEISAANKSTIAAADGNYYDWLELHNTTDKTVSLRNCSLTDKEENLLKWVMPSDAAIEPDGYMVVFCSGLDKFEDGEMHTNFKIRSAGEKVMLYDNTASAVVSTAEYVRCLDDMSIGFVDSAAVFYPEPTPGAPNGDTFFSDFNALIKDTFTVEITECCSDNDGSLKDSDGDSPDWAEIYNNGQKAVNLSRLYLTDREGDSKWQFPEDAVLQPGQYLAMFLSGKDKAYDGSELHADFGLCGDDKFLSILGPDKTVIDTMDLLPMKHGVSIGKSSSGEIVYYTDPTPGKTNDTAEYPNLEAATSLSLREIWISEVMAISCSRNDVCSNKADWVEIYNGSDAAVSLDGWGLSDKKDEPFRFRFSGTTIDPGEYLVITLNGTDDPENLTAAFKLSNNGETLYLTRPDGRTADDFAYGRQVKNVSTGRYGSDSDQRMYFSKPTKGEPNSHGVLKCTPLPRFSVDDVYVDSGAQIELDAPDYCTIRYTTDGTKPNESSKVYSSPFTIEKDTIIRAACFADDAVCGGVSSHTYVVSNRHELPVVCLCSDPDGLFGYYNGIFADGPGISDVEPYRGANFWMDWEREIHFEYYEPDGKNGIDFDAGIRIFGEWSRYEHQKSISVHLREAYGPSSVTYPFFENNEVHEFSDILLRSGGQDVGMSKLRDALYVKIMEGEMDVDTMDYSPVVVYMNGEYFGLYNMREKVNEKYLLNHGRISDERVDIIKANSTTVAGNRKAYNELKNYVRTHDLSVEENYRYVCSIVDIQQMMDYFMVETFSGNSDTDNIKVYKGYGENDKWRWILFDLDLTLMKKHSDSNLLRELFTENTRYFDTTLPRALIKNKEFREKFIENYANRLNTTFAPERTTKILREMAAKIESEIPRQHERWGEPSVRSWNNSVNSVEYMLSYRAEICKKQLKNQFNLSDERMKELFPE
ncbi:MAG: lamin tail domain-containing protein [Clostridia bacterium]|nr:lamin tail domain-containing protein [Clostridia bacterium]